VTDDPELADRLRLQLGALMGQAAATSERNRRERFEALWRARYPTWRRTAVLVAGPPTDTAACAGGSRALAAESPRCATTWPEGNARVDAELARTLPPEAIPPPTPTDLPRVRAPPGGPPPPAP
jgi:hypothetical protein